MGIWIEGLPREVKYVLLDFDGTIIDARPKWWQPVEDAFVEITGNVPEKELEQNAGKIISNLPQKPSKLFLIKVLWGIGRFGGLSFYQNLQFILISRSKFAKSKYINQLIPGVTDFLDFLESKNIPIAIVTTAAKDEIDFAIKDLPGFDRYKYVTRDDVANLKPHPEPILKGLEKIQADPDYTVFAGDFRSDIEAGNAAQVMTIALTGPFPEISKPGLISVNPSLMVQYLPDLIEMVYIPNSDGN